LDFPLNSQPPLLPSWTSTEPSHYCEHRVVQPATGIAETLLTVSAWIWRRPPHQPWADYWYRSTRPGAQLGTFPIDRKPRAV